MLFEFMTPYTKDVTKICDIYEVHFVTLITWFKKMFDEIVKQWHVNDVVLFGGNEHKEDWNQQKTSSMRLVQISPQLYTVLTRTKGI